MEKATLLGGLYLMVKCYHSPPLKALAICQAPDITTAIRRCLRCDPNFLQDIFLGDFCDEIDAKSVHVFFAEHTEWADLYMAFVEQYPCGETFPGAEALAAMAAFPIDMLAHILQHGKVYEPTVLNLASLPLVALQDNLLLSKDLWLLYDDIEKSTADLKLLAAPDEATARRSYIELEIDSREFLERIAAEDPWAVIFLRRADAGPLPAETQETIDRHEAFFANDVRSFFAGHTDWAELYLMHHSAGDLSVDVVASFPKDMIFYIYEEYCGLWLFATDLSTFPFIKA